MSDSSQRRASAKPEGEMPLQVVDTHGSTSTDPPTIISQRAPYATPSTTDGLRGPAWALALENQQLDHFLIEQYVGGGGMGAVFRALDLRLDRTVALKLLPPEPVADEEMVRRFEKEARSAARLDHENVARVHYRGEDRGYRFIALEFVEGTNLRELVERRGPLPLAESVRIVLQVAEALAHFARRDVVHRDIKPSNLLVTAEGLVKLIDLGLARLSKSADEDLTSTGTTLGTFDYIAPEQARDPRAADVRSDIYSLGCTWYYALTGRPPFPEGTVLQKLLQHQGDEPPDPRQFRDDLPESAHRVLCKMLAKDATRRYATAEALIDDLSRLADEFGVSASGDRAAPRSGRLASWWSRVEQHVPWLAPIVMLGLLVWLLDSWTRPEATPTRLALGLQEPLASATQPSPQPLVPRESDTQAETNTEIVSGDRSTVPEQDVPVTNQPQEFQNKPDAAERAQPTNDAPDESARTPQADSRSRLEALFPIRSRPTESTAVPPDSASTVSGSSIEPERALPDTGDLGHSPTIADPVTSDRSRMVRPETSEFGDSGSRSIPMESEIAGPSVQSATDPFSSGSIPSASRSTTIATQGLLIVSDRQHASLRTFSSLKAACAAARSGDSIELRYDGFREELPLELANLTLTIRAGSGFRPVIVFRPMQADPYAYPRRMLRVVGGRLTLADLHVVLDLSRGVAAESWSLFECEAAELLRLERCTLTIRNAADIPSAFHEDVAFVRVRSAPGPDTMHLDEPAEPRTPLAIQLQATIARGEAVFLQADAGQPVELNWDNGLLATSERMIRILGSRNAPPVGETVRIDLRHVTVHSRHGLLWLGNTSDAPYQLPTEVHCVNSIVLVDPDSPLIEQQGVDTVRDFRERLIWTGERNFYQGFAIFWKISGLDTASEPQQVTLATWQTLNKVQEHLPTWGRVRWRRGPDLAQPRHRDLAADYALLDDVAATPARRGASDGLDAGALLNLLPDAPELPIAGRP